MGKRSRATEEAIQRKKNVLDSALPNSWTQLDDSDLDADLDAFESQPRRFADAGAEDEALPIIVDGKVQRVKRPRKAMKDSESQSGDDGDSDSGLGEGSNEDSSFEEEIPGRQEMSELEVKELIAAYAELIMTEPEVHLAKVRELQQLAVSSKRGHIRQLLILSLSTLYKSIIPGYRIKELTEAQRQEKASKEVRELREFEQRLLAVYRRFVELLVKSIALSRGNDVPAARYAVGGAALEAACQLAESVPHFNWRHDLVAAIISKLSSQRVDAQFLRAIDCMVNLLESDDEGHVTLEIVQLVSRMIKSRRYKVDSRVVAALVGIQLLTDMPSTMPDEPNDPLRKLKKKNRIPLSKRQRKQRREQREIDDEMRKAEQAVSTEMRAKLQGQTLQVLFRLYLEILKSGSRHLLGSALEGLASYAHLVNTELFGDLLEVLREVIDNSRTTRQTLLSTVTAQRLLRAQGKASTPLDLSYFAQKLYQVMPMVVLDPHVEERHRSLASSHSGKLASETDMLVVALEQLFSRASPAASRSRTLAFARRLGLLAPHCPPRTSLVLLRVLSTLCERFPYVRAMLTTQDRVMRGGYDAESDNPDLANAEVATMWELALVRLHYAPEVAKAASQI